jgi:hypothetical protein
MGVLHTSYVLIPILKSLFARFVKMPEVSRFLGIVITMYAEAGARHKSPHFHARFGEHKATLEIALGDTLAGSLPNAQLHLVEAWAILRRAELDQDWRLLVAGQSPNKIAPLK